MSPVRRRHPRASQAGFSLLELTVGVVIGGLLLALLVNGASLLASRRLTGTARKLVSDMRMLEGRARAERTCYRIIFDPVGNRYDIHRYDGVVAPSGGGGHCADGTAWSPILVREDAGDRVSRRMPSGVDLVSTSFLEDTMVMSPLGNANAGTVTMRTPSGMDRQVVVEVMGRVRIVP